MEIILLHHHKSLRLASNFLRVLPLDIHTLTTYTPSLHTHPHHIHTLTTYTPSPHTHPHHIHILTIYTCVCACSQDSAISGDPVGFRDMTTHFTNPWPHECMGAGQWNLTLSCPHPTLSQGKGANDKWVMLSQLFSALKKPMNST